VESWGGVGKELNSVGGGGVKRQRKGKPKPNGQTMGTRQYQVEVWGSNELACWND